MWTANVRFASFVAFLNNLFGQLKAAIALQGHPLDNVDATRGIVRDSHLPLEEPYGAKLGGPFGFCE